MKKALRITGKVVVTAGVGALFFFVIHSAAGEDSHWLARWFFPCFFSVLAMVVSLLMYRVARTDE